MALLKEISRSALKEALEYAAKLADLIKASGPSEVEGVLKTLGAGYLEPGLFGSLSTKGAAILPTGRSAYGMDPRALPTRAAWEVGVKAAEKLLKRYLEQHGRYPETVGQQFFSLDGLNADGRQLAAVLYLFGVKPIWGADGRVAGLEAIPLEELKRPRIDNLINISGVLRDVLPHYINIINEAFIKVVELNEPMEYNYPKKHYLEHLSKLLSQGVQKEEAEELAALRVFGPMPGSYGAGVQDIVEGKGWRERGDLAEAWIATVGYGYGRRLYGAPAQEALRAQLATVDVVAKDRYRDDEGPLSLAGDDWFGFLGGFYAAVKHVRGHDVDIVIYDTRDISRIDVRGLREEIEREAEAKLLNPAWIEGMKRHGYRGASEFAERFFYVFGWSATTGLVSDALYNRLAQTYVLNEEMRRWFTEHNPYALEDIVDRLLEAVERGLWRAPREVAEELRRIYSEVEAELE